MKNQFLPLEDGLTHINIYSKAKTELGKFLSNFQQISLETEDGKFQSIEGLWYWLQCSDDYQFKEDLRYLSGNSAKKIGREVREKFPHYIDQDEFQRKIKLAIKNKVVNSSFLKEFIDSVLPFTHYYLMYGKQKFADSKNDWVIEYLEQLRQELKIKEIQI